MKDERHWLVQHINDTEPEMIFDPHIEMMIDLAVKLECVLITSDGKWAWKPVLAHAPVIPKLQAFISAWVRMEAVEVATSEPLKPRLLGPYWNAMTPDIHNQAYAQVWAICGLHYYARTLGIYG